MQVRIHRGAAEIGGSCVELLAEDESILLDLGKPLWAQRDEQVPLPPVRGIGAAGPAPLAILVSHGHQDHWGLIPQLSGQIPVWVGQGAADVLRAAQFWGTGIDLAEAGHYQHRTHFTLGPFTITPYLADHSGFDAYSLLVEAGGRRLFYTGDLRGHGRKHAAFEWLLDDPPSNIDVLLMEGTNLRADHQAASTLDTESDVEDQLLNTLSQTKGLAVALASAQNIDRLVTVYRAATRAGRRLAVELYTAEVLRAAGRETIPQLGDDWSNLAVYVPNSQRARIVRSQEFDRVAEIRSQRVLHETLLQEPEQWALYGAYQSSISRFLELGLLADGVVVWSLWDGYLKESRGVALTSQLAVAEVPVVHHHTSGHASVSDLKRLVQALAPARLVPIHTGAPERFAAHFPCMVECHPDGTW